MLSSSARQLGSQSPDLFWSTGLGTQDSTLESTRRPAMQQSRMLLTRLPSASAVACPKDSCSCTLRAITFAWLWLSIRLHHSKNAASAIGHRFKP